MALPVTTSVESAAVRRVTQETAVSRRACPVPTASTVIRCVSAQRGTSCATRCRGSATVLRGSQDPNVIRSVRAGAMVQTVRERASV
ncbi:hypothetical protein QTP70_032728 [Hemibagrus guttatus]|uniref:Uncharacterized protein n=1 Tax=Hemibagrus guttatus TaxID=175788 RepID=A0AAE0UMQ4_9TELE|nr:hypothetical protein QTP70_032728 [Hemibagrus guttatus]